MARRKKGRPIHGWLILDKPKGMTSTAAVGRARWLLDAKKAGHAGTLDPAATGLLVIAFGEATKAIPYVTDAMKAYRFKVRWGEARNTDDLEGEITGTTELRPDEAQIRAALPGLTGDIMQVPPAFSAVKVDGQRAYALARGGEDVTLAERPLFVESLTLTEMPDKDHAVFEMVCGKGGYVRAIARDLGEMLGCLGHVTDLRRIWSGPFDLSDAAPKDCLDADRDQTRLNEALLPLEAGLSDLPEQKIRPEGAARLRNGNPGQVTYSDLEFGEECWASCDGQPVAIGVYEAGFRPSVARFRALGRLMIERRHETEETKSVAVFSDCEAYRYLLTRVWDPTGKRALFVMLNPSTADEFRNDPTVERCERRARALGFGAFRVTNIFAFRATDPKVMRAAADPVGPGNNAAIDESARDWADAIVCAWGNHGQHLQRGAEVRRLLAATGQPLHHLGLTGAQEPKHPLYISYSQALIEWHLDR